MIPLITVLTFILLARAFRSLILPLKAVLLNLLSVGAAWGLMVLVLQHGWGSDAIWGIEATQAINVEMPIVIFAFLFGISMDYQVFIISRMREAYDRTGSTDDRRRRGHRPHRPAGHERRADPRPRLRRLQRHPGTEAKMFATALGGGILHRRHASSAASSPRPPSRCSAAGTGGCPPGRAAAARRARSQPRVEAKGAAATAAAPYV